MHACLTQHNTAGSYIYTCVCPSPGHAAVISVHHKGPLVKRVVLQHHHSIGTEAPHALPEEGYVVLVVKVPHHPLDPDYVVGVGLGLEVLPCTMRCDAMRYNVTHQQTRNMRQVG
jgi:hypothetical protein